MLLVFVLVGALVLWWGQRRSWHWVRWLGRQWQRARGPVWSWLATAPVTFIYLGLLAFTTWLLLRTSPHVREAYLQAQSTNLHQLGIDPIPVLLRSAFYVDPLELVLWVVAFAVILAPLERWMGSRLWLVAFWVGHVGATLVTAVGIGWLVRKGDLPRDVAFQVDVGASYGVAALFGVATYWFDRRGRWVWAGLGVVVSGLAWAVMADFTSAGHMVAFLLGLAMYPLVRRLTPRAPVFRPHGMLRTPGHREAPSTPGSP